MAEEHKLDIFKAMAAMDDCDGDWFVRQSEEARKGFAPPVFLRWASTVQGDGLAAAYTLVMVNERLNQNFWEIAKHPELAFRLAASCGTQLGVRHGWVAMVGGARGENKARNLVASFYPGANNREIDLLMSKFDRDSFREFANEAGITAEEVKEVVKAYDKLSSKGSIDAKETKISKPKGRGTKKK